MSVLDEFNGDVVYGGPSEELPRGDIPFPSKKKGEKTMKNNYTVRLSRCDQVEDKPLASTEIGDLMSGSFTANLQIRAYSAEDACKLATDYMEKKTHDGDWEVFGLEMNCCGPVRGREVW